MHGSSIHTHSDTAVISVAAAHAPEIITSAEFDERLMPTYERVGAMKISTHNVRSPLESINNSCQGCHNVAEDELRGAVIRRIICTLSLDFEWIAEDIVGHAVSSPGSG